jgi:hypothetical protein
LICSNLYFSLLSFHHILSHLILSYLILSYPIRFIHHHQSPSTQSPPIITITINRELPRVLTIYDIDLPLPEAQQAIRHKFNEYSNIQDTRVVSMLVEKGYMDLEETLLQHTQRSHLLRSLSHNVEMEGSARKRLTVDSSIDEQFARGY